MACFMVPLTEAIVTTLAEKHLAKKAEKGETPHWAHKVKWLSNMLWGGSALLMFEHLWHGEITPFAPFFTAAESADGLSIMLKEMATSGVAMAVLVTACWGLLVAATEMIEKRSAETAK